jgi:hypothetical protein
MEVIAQCALGDCLAHFAARGDHDFTLLDVPKSASQRVTRARHSGHEFAMGIVTRIFGHRVGDESLRHFALLAHALMIVSSRRNFQPALASQTMEQEGSHP